MIQVINVIPKPYCSLYVKFADGFEKSMDIKPFIKKGISIFYVTSA